MPESEPRLRWPAWLVGLLIDVNFGGDWQMLYLRVLLPVLAMGLRILGELKKK